jgi:hypothetical protein
MRCEIFDHLLLATGQKDEARQLCMMLAAG